MATLDSGTRLGPYEIVAPLGAGGMGEVYRARDTRLDREVAVKVLPAHTSSPQAFERFEREAKAIAALNHPGICAIYDVGSSPVPFLVMELLDGDTLHQRLARGPLEVGGLVDTGLALADALASAHGKGIVHRDLKPANIVLTARGPKILDFGLARISEAVSAEVAGTAGPTLSAHGPITNAGVAVGTAAYMSPEQLRGEPLDARTDLFSLGLVLYEMATGRRAFQGSTSVVTSAAILHDEPTAPCELRPDIPVRLERAIMTLLEKDREVRTQSASELRAELTRIKRELTGSRAPDPAASSAGAGSRASDRVDGVTAPPPGSSDAQLIAGVMRRHRRLVAGFAAVLLLAVGGAAYYFTRTSPGAAAIAGAPISIGDLQLEQLTTSGSADGPAISPDGKYVAYIDGSNGGDSLRVRQVATGSNVEILPPEPGVRLMGLTVTPDGVFVTYLKLILPRPPELWQIPFLGGSPQRLLQGAGGRVGFSADGTQMAYVRQAGANQTELVVTAIDGSNPKVLAQRRPPEGFLSTGVALASAVGPSWSPDGKTLAVLGFSVAGTEKDTGQVVFVDVQTGSQQAVNAGPPLIGAAVAWLDNQWLVISMLQRSSEPMQLWLLSHGTGEFRRLSNDLSQYMGVSLTATRDALVTGRSDVSCGIWTSDASAERWTQAVPDTQMKGPIGFGIAWMGDDLAYVASTSSGFALMRRNAAGETEIVARSAGDPSVSLDGATIAYFDYDSGEMFKTDASGANRVLLSRGFGPRPRITPDGRSVARIAIGAGSAPKLRLYSLDGTGRVLDVHAERVANGPAEVSPDGRLVAYTSVDDQQRAAIAVCSLADCSARHTLPSQLRWHWTPDGRALAYVEREKQSDIWVQPLDGSAPRPLTHFTSDGRIIADFGWSPDGKRLAVARSKASHNIVMFRGLRRSSDPRNHD